MGSSLVMIVMLVVAWVVFFWSIQRRFRLMALGKPTVRWDSVGARIVDTLKYAIGQQRMPRYALTGWLHIIIFFGFLILLLRSVILWGRGAYAPDFNLDLLFGPVHDMNLLGQLYTAAKDVVALAVLTAAAVALYNRVVKKPARLTQSSEANLILVIIITMMLGDIVYDAAEILLYWGAAGAHEEAGGPLFIWYEPVGYAASLVLGPMLTFFGADLTAETPTSLIVASDVGFWVHSTLVLVFLNLLPYGKHFHVVTAIPNVFLRDLNPPGRIPPIENLEAAMEEMDENDRFGIGQVTDFTWKGLLDFYSCTECGRCTDNCPANQTGKKLSPKHLTIHLRNNLYGRESELLGDEPAEPVGAQADAEPSEGPVLFGHHGDEVPAVPELLPDVVDPEEVWACTTCRACERECPVFISYVDKIVGLRRHLVLDQGDVPQELANALRGLETNSNPWNISAMDRAKWAEDVDVRILGDLAEDEAKAVEYLLFVGCAASFDDRAKKVAKATVQLLNVAGVDFAILGTEELCTGDIARRAGNEYLFQTMAQANIEVLSRYDVTKIITICPHCFNTFKNEYPDFGGHYQVLSHAQFLTDLVRDGRLRPKSPVSAVVAYHDSCYLGRYNEIYDGPRELLQSIPGVRLVEPEEKKRDRALCCGAGGAQYFKEEEPGNERVNLRRTHQLLATGCDTIATACPFCMTMLTDGLKAENKEEDISQLDLAEILARSCGLSRPKGQTEDAA